MKIPSVLLLAILLGVCLLWPAPVAPAWFGDQTIRTSLLSIENTIVCLRRAPASNGTLDSITCYLNLSNAGEVDWLVRYAIYNYNGGTPTPLVDSTAEFWIYQSDPDGWRSRPTIIDASISSTTTYDICAWANNDALESINSQIQSGQTGYYVDYQAITYGVWPATLTEATLSNYSMSMYATYTEGGVPGVHPRRRRIMGQIGGVQFDLPADSVPASFWGAP